MSVHKIDSVTESRFLGNPCKLGHSGLRYRSNGRCVECARASSKDWQVANRVKARASSSKWMEKNGTAQRFKQRYGLTVEKYKQMVKEQDGKCAICLKPPTGKGSGAKLHVDHDHKTGKIRMLLCHFCNHGLGNFQDDPQSLESAAKYLRSH